ncbi:hypothetical protein P8452_13474 [Trifolium repens]|nr:hypothetical protein P8452_13474 [Trifolium repens]
MAGGLRGSSVSHLHVTFSFSLFSLPESMSFLALAFRLSFQRSVEDLQLSGSLLRRCRRVGGLGFLYFGSPAPNWRDSFKILLAPNAPKPQDLPVVCRDITLEYGAHVKKLGITLFELLSEALGLNPNHLKDMDCYYIGGLQILHQDKWVDVPPIPGAFVVNFGEALQLISNDRFKSAEHRD